MRENYVESSAHPAVCRIHTHTTASLYSVCRVTSIVSSTVYSAPVFTYSVYLSLVLHLQMPMSVLQIMATVTTCAQTLLGRTVVPVTLGTTFHQTDTTAMVQHCSCVSTVALQYVYCM